MNTRRKRKRRIRLRIGLIAVLLILVNGYIFSYPLFSESRYAEFKKKGGTRETIRTPDERFENLPGFDFAPHYVEIDGLRIHFLDEGPLDADPVLLLHGEPSWCYLYRKMIPPITAAGHRAVAPDLIGFGRSDKLVRRRDYSYQLQVDMVTAFIKILDLKNITVFCQDWGGLIGLRVVAENPDRFARVVVANTALPAILGSPNPLGAIPTNAFLGFPLWLTFSQLSPIFRAGDVLQFGTVRNLSPQVIAAYNAPFPDSSYKAASRVYPALVGSQLRENRRAWESLSRWQKPFLTAFGDSDPILGGGDRIFQKMVPGAKDQPHTTIKDASHFLQEDKGEELGALVVDFIAST